MIDKIKEEIDKDKKDRKIYKEYIKAFVETSKAQELFASNYDFIKIKESVEKKEDEFE